MPTLLDYPGVSWIQNESPSLPYGSLNLLDKSEFGYFFSTKDEKSSEFYLQIKKIIAFSCKGGCIICYEILLNFGLPASILGTFSL